MRKKVSALAGIRNRPGAAGYGMVRGGCDREFMCQAADHRGTRASRRCRPAVILTAELPMRSGRPQAITAGTAMFHNMNPRSHPTAEC